MTKTKSSGYLVEVIGYHSGTQRSLRYRWYLQAIILLACIPGFRFPIDLTLNESVKPHGTELSKIISCVIVKKSGIRLSWSQCHLIHRASDISKLIQKAASPFDYGTEAFIFIINEKLKIYENFNLTTLHSFLYIHSLTTTPITKHGSSSWASRSGRRKDSSS